MEKYLTLVLPAAPGFIAARIAVVLGITSYVLQERRN